MATSLVAVVVVEQTKAAQPMAVLVELAVVVTALAPMALLVITELHQLVLAVELAGLAQLTLLVVWAALV